jgi:hypothetical protein
VALDTLNEHDRRILDLEAQRWDTAGGKEQAIRDRLGMSPVRFYQRLNQLLDTEQALAVDPLMVNRLRRIRASRAERHRLVATIR